MLEKGSSFATGATNANGSSGGWFSTAIDDVGKWFQQAGSDIGSFFSNLYNDSDYALSEYIYTHPEFKNFLDTVGIDTSPVDEGFFDNFADFMNKTKGLDLGKNGNKNGKDDNVDPLQKLIDDFFSKFASSTEAANILAQQNATTAMNFEREEAEKLRQWQEYMENSYWQRQRKSMVDAGYNPWMAIYGNQTPTYSSTLPSSSMPDTFRSQEKLSDYIMLLPLLVQLGRVVWSSLSNSSSKNSLLSVFK